MCIRDRSELGQPRHENAEVRPPTTVSSLVQATRQLFGNLGDAPVPDSWPMQNPLIAVFGGIIVFVVIFCPLAIRRYNQSS